jgi:hypothetical protein
MKIAIMALAVLPLAACTTGPRYADGYGYEYGGRTYASYDECMAAKRSSRTTGAVVGAVAGAGVAAAAGGNTAEIAAGAGGGALAGTLVGNTRRC